MVSRPPEILITTPETLNILLSAKNARRILTGVATVILDEIHAVAGTKRGTPLITAVDRLVPLCGEFQRLALSATVRPAETVAAFVGGYRMEGDPADPAYRARPVARVSSTVPKAVAVEVCFPAGAKEILTDDSWWPALTARFVDIIRRHRATLLFANSRRLTEKVTRLINEAAADGDREGPLAWSHHGSLSKELRLAVEQRLKRGELSAIVATNSLELGIDIGELDRVVLVQTPSSVSSALQRIGRSGHRVDAESRGAVFPTHGADFLHAAVMARCVETGDIEPIHPPRAPLDVLAQVLLSMLVTEAWPLDELYAFLRASTPYHRLSRPIFDRGPSGRQSSGPGGAVAGERRSSRPDHPRPAAAHEQRPGLRGGLRPADRRHRHALRERRFRRLCRRSAWDTDAFIRSILPALPR